MSDLPTATRGADEFLPPSADTTDQSPTVTAVTTSAAVVDLGTRFSRGGAYVTFQARGGDVYLRARAATAAAATTSGNGSNGVKIADGTDRNFWISPDSRYIDVIGSTSCSLFWYQSSPNYSNRPPR